MITGHVFIAISLDGFVARSSGELDWLMKQETKGEDHGYDAFMESVDGLVCFGYPLKGVGKTAKLRDEVLIALDTPILFLQGTRDKLCPLDLLADVRGKMKAPSELFVVETGDHSLQATKTSLKQQAETQDDIDGRILAAVRSFWSSTIND